MAVIKPMGMANADNIITPNAAIAGPSLGGGPTGERVRIKKYSRQPKNGNT
jgi:hypothetical protein